MPSTSSFSTHPHVLVSCSLTSPVAPPELNIGARWVAERVVAELPTVGLRGRLIDAADSSSQKFNDLEEGIGLIVLGGSDVHPHKYGVREVHPSTYGTNPDADEFEISLVRRAVDAGMPVIGICRGMQLLNVALGGTLEQDINQERTTHNVSGSYLLLNSHPVHVQAQTKLAAIYGSGSLDIQSGHHQAVARLGEGLRVSATAQDGVVEAIELIGSGWGLGVQWHPEVPGAEARQFALLLQELARQCDRYQASVSAAARQGFE